MNRYLFTTSFKNFFETDILEGKIRGIQAMNIELKTIEELNIITKQLSKTNTTDTTFFNLIKYTKLNNLVNSVFIHTNKLAPYQQLLKIYLIKKYFTILYLHHQDPHLYHPHILLSM